VHKDLIDIKRELRRRCGILRNTLSEFERGQKSRSICHHLLLLPQVVADTFFIYVSYKTEVATSAIIKKLLEQGKTVVIPHIHHNRMDAVQLIDPERELEEGFKGIPELRIELVEKRIINPARIKVAIVPGLAFDKKGGRLGYGGGCYDRFFADRAPGALRVGVCFSRQIVDEVPTERHDVKMDLVIHEQGIIKVD